ncbi:MAG: hypothetical protein NUW37_11585 [Planctomycetes bacterium]|nr:hypothetical protein [Planctomycetota bacterium]
MILDFERRTLVVPLLLAAMTVLLPANAAVADDSDAGIRHEERFDSGYASAHFFVRVFNPEYESLAAVFAKELEDAYRDISKKLSLSVDRRINVFIHQNTDSFSGSSIGYGETSADGFTDFLQKRIVVPPMTSVRRIRASARQRVIEVLLLEYYFPGTTRSFDLLTIPFYPSWMFSGLVNWAKGDAEVNDYHASLYSMVREDKFPQLYDLHGFAHLNLDDMRAATNFSRAVVEYVRAEYEDLLLSRMIKEFNWISPEESFKRTLGLDYAELQRRTVRYIKMKFEKLQRNSAEQSNVEIWDLTERDTYYPYHQLFPIRGIPTGLYFFCNDRGRFDLRWRVDITERDDLGNTVVSGNSMKIDQLIPSFVSQDDLSLYALTIADGYRGISKIPKRGSVFGSVGTERWRPQLADGRRLDHFSDLYRTKDGRFIMIARLAGRDFPVVASEYHAEFHPLFTEDEEFIDNIPKLAMMPRPEPTAISEAPVSRWLDEAPSETPAESPGDASPENSPESDSAASEESEARDPDSFWRLVPEESAQPLTPETSGDESEQKSGDRRAARDDEPEAAEEGRGEGGEIQGEDTEEQSEQDDSEQTTNDESAETPEPENLDGPAPSRLFALRHLRYFRPFESEVEARIPRELVDPNYHFAAADENPEGDAVARALAEKEKTIEVVYEYVWIEEFEGKYRIVCQARLKESGDAKSVRLVIADLPGHANMLDVHQMSGKIVAVIDCELGIAKIALIDLKAMKFRIIDVRFEGVASATFSQTADVSYRMNDTLAPPLMLYVSGYENQLASMSRLVVPVDDVESDSKNERYRDFSFRLYGKDGENRGEDLIVREEEARDAFNLDYAIALVFDNAARISDSSGKHVFDVGLSMGLNFVGSFSGTRSTGFAGSIGPYGRYTYYGLRPDIGSDIYYAFSSDRSANIEEYGIRPFMVYPFSRSRWARVEYNLKWFDIDDRSDPLGRESARYGGFDISLRHRDIRSRGLNEIAGSYLHIDLDFYRGWMASERNFNRYAVDTGFLIEPFEDHVFAARVGFVKRTKFATLVGLGQSPGRVRGVDATFDPGSFKFSNSVEYRFPIYRDAGWGGNLLYLKDIRGYLFHDSGFTHSETTPYSYSYFRHARYARSYGVGLRLDVFAFQSFGIPFKFELIKTKRAMKFGRDGLEYELGVVGSWGF